MRAETREYLWPGGIIAAFVLALFVPLWSAGHSVYFSVIEEGFPVAANYPWDMFAAKCLSMGRFPLWNPYASGGTVFLANWLEAFFFLPRWPLYLTPNFLIRDIYVIARFWLGGMFLFMFLRRIGLKRAGAVAAVLCFLSAGYFTRYFNENYLTIELLAGLWLLAADYLATRRSFRSVLLCALAVVGIIFAGHPTAGFHALALMGLWIIWRSGQARPRAVTLFIASGLIGGLAASAQLLTFAESWVNSVNCHIPGLGRAHYELRHLATMAFPWIYGDWGFFSDYHRVPELVRGSGYIESTISWLPFYIGVVPLLLAGACLVRLRKSNRSAAFFGAYALAGMGMIFGIDPFRFLSGLPLIEEMGNYKHLFTPVLVATSALAGMGLDTLSRESPRNAMRTLLFVGAALAALGFYAAFKSAAPGRWGEFLITGILPPAVVTGLFAIRPRGMGVAGAIAAIAVMGLAYPSGYRYLHQLELTQMNSLPFVKYLEKHPEGRFMSLYPPLFPNLGMIWGLADMRGLDALQPQRYWNKLLDINDISETGMHAYFFTAGVIGPMPEKIGHPGMKELGVRYVVSPGDPGGTMAVRYLARKADIRLPEAGHFHWSVWKVGGEERPVLYTHPPISIELPRHRPSGIAELETAVAFHPNTPAGADGAFMMIVEESGGDRRVRYARHISGKPEKWIKVPELPAKEKGATGRLLVHPGADAERDWAGWSLHGPEESFAGYRLVSEGKIRVYEAENPPPRATLIREDGYRAEPEPSVKMLYPDKYLVNTRGMGGDLKLNFLGYRPGWKARQGGRELKIGPDRTVNVEADSGPIILEYTPVSFAIGLWVTITTILLGIFSCRRRKSLLHGKKPGRSAGPTIASW